MSRMRSLNAQLQRAGLGDAVCCGQQRRTTDPRPRKSPSLLQPLGTHSAAFAAPARPACSAASCSSSTSSVSSNWRCRTCSTGRQRRFVCRAADDAKAAPVKQQLPIFVLGLVAFPHAVVPLMIFEPRYRVLFNTLLDGGEGVEEGLVQKESPFCGTRTFGLCFADERGRLCSMGTLLKIEQWVHESDGRIYVTCLGLQRFRITNVVKEKPVLICDVEVLPEDDDQSEQAQKLKQEVAELFRNTLRLHQKMNRRQAQGSGGSSSSRFGSAGGAAAAGSGAEVSEEEEANEPEELTEFGPSKFSYFIANIFQDSRYTQQALLEESSTMTRLEKEKEILTATMKYYSAATALEGIFSSGSSEAGEAAQPPPGGPD